MSGGTLLTQIVNTKIDKNNFKLKRNEKYAINFTPNIVNAVNIKLSIYEVE